VRSAFPQQRFVFRAWIVLAAASAGSYCYVKDIYDCYITGQVNWYKGQGFTVKTHHEVDLASVPILCDNFNGRYGCGDMGHVSYCTLWWLITQYPICDIGFPHNNGNSVGFADGHAKWMTKNAVVDGGSFNKLIWKWSDRRAAG